MKKRNDLIFITIFIVVVSISLLYLFQASYAKYKRQINANASARVASWNIKVNNETINNKSVLTNEITPVITSDTYVKEGVIAPGSKGYFDLTINASEVDVDFNYEISFGVKEETPLLDLVVTEYEMNGTKITYDEENGITGEIQKNTGNTSIRVYFEWDDSATNQMNNKDDTDYAINSSYTNTKIKVNIKFNQKNSA